MSNYLIIGASSGIGRELAHQLSGSGNTVYGTWYSHETPSESPHLHYHPLNVLDESIALDFAPESLSGLVYCPGTIQLRPFDRIKPSEFLNDFSLQVGGAIKVIQAALPRLKKNGQGSVVLFSTVAVGTGLPFHTQVAVSKGAIEGLTRALAAEFAPTIRVNCIAPSLTDTPLAKTLLNTDQKREANAQRHPMKRVGTATDMANMARFLLSDESSWITGQILHVDGGMSSLKI